MARMPGVQQLSICDNGTMTEWSVVVLHTIVGYAAGGTAAHFTTDAWGTIVQARDTGCRSAACLNGNSFCIAIENEDHGTTYGTWNTNDGHAVPAFTDAQVEANAKILAWCHMTHGIPLELIPDTMYGRRGVCEHRRGIDPRDFPAGYDFDGRVPGGVLLSSAYGKVCPGDRRIHQMIDLVIPRARVLVGLDAPPTHLTEDDVMYIKCGDPPEYAILTGLMFIGLGSAAEKASADAAIAAGATLQWVERWTWDAMDARSHAQYDKGPGIPVKNTAELDAMVRQIAADVAELRARPSA